MRNIRTCVRVCVSCAYGIRTNSAVPPLRTAWQRLWRALGLELVDWLNLRRLAKQARFAAGGCSWNSSEIEVPQAEWRRIRPHVSLKKECRKCDVPTSLEAGSRRDGGEATAVELRGVALLEEDL